MPKILNKKQKIMNTAIKLFVKNGFHNTSMQALAKKAGVATGSIYTYFPSKDNLISELFLSLIAEVDEYLRADYDANASIEARFRYLIAKRIAFNLKYPLKFKLMGMYARSRDVMSFIDEDDIERSPMYRVIDDGERAGIFRNYPRCDIFYFIFGGIGSLLESRIKSAESVSEQDVNNIIDMCWNSIKN